MAKKINSAIVIVISFTLITFVTYFADKSFSKKAVCSDKVGTGHTAFIQNNVIVPLNTSAKLCDTLTIINADDTSRIIAFGQHEKHIIYDGKGETPLIKNQSLKILLSKKGTYIFHDHYNEDVKGTFTVN